MSHIFDASTFGQAFARPGMDTRQWTTFGLVAPDATGQPSIAFDDDDGNPMPEGPLIAVILQPSNITVACRVAGGVAGNGEGDWFPFQANDEVIVAVPEGDERAGCTIIGRMNNELDAWPRVVAGQDATQNNFGFRRMRTPYILETAASYLVRSALTGAQFGIDQTGQFLLNDGDGSRIFMGADAVGMSTADGKTSMQMLVGDNQIALTAGGTASFLLDAAASQFTSKGTLSLGTSGLLSLQHAVTLENLIGILANFVIFLSMNGVTELAPLVATLPEPLQTGLFTMLQGATLPTPPIGTAPGPLAYGGNFATWPLLFGPAGVGATLLGTQVANLDVTGFIPGIGRAGFLF